jgi:NAD(P)-dependent dehydrogenase (short-subunit alcohol dehydrogenase family)
MELTYGEGVALVAGGSGGIGADIATSLADVGVPVALTFNRNRGAADALVEKLSASAEGYKARAYPWSGSSEDEANRLVAQVTEDCGPIRFLIVASGISQQSAFHTLEEAQWRSIIDIDLNAAISLTRAVITPMMKSGSGRVLFLGSVAGRRGIQGLSVYAAAKAGLEGLTRGVAREAAPFGVTVNCVAPGFIETPMIAEMPEKVKQRWIRSTPVGRFGLPKDVTPLVCLLLSEQATYVTGQTWVVDGGLSL